MLASPTMAAAARRSRETAEGMLGGLRLFDVSGQPLRGESFLGD